jgi:hypothetical protein
MNERISKTSRNKKIIVVAIVILLSGVLGIFLYTRYFLKPEFNLIDIETNPTDFHIQNIGKADAHNVKIKFNGTWIPNFRMNTTKVEHGYMTSSEQIVTVFYGAIESSEDWYLLARRIVPSIVGGETDGATFVKLAVVENGVWRYLTDDEVASLIEAFENPRAYYTYGETTIDVLRVGEIKEVKITLKEPFRDFYEIFISCDEGISLQFSP